MEENSSYDHARQLGWKGRLSVWLLTPNFIVGGVFTYEGVTAIVENKLSAVGVAIIALTLQLTAWKFVLEQAARRDAGAVTRAVLWTTIGIVGITSTWFSWQGLGIRPSHEHHMVAVVGDLRDDLGRTRKAVATEARVAPLLDDATKRLGLMTSREATTGRGPIHEAKRQLQEKFESAASTLREGQKEDEDTLRKIESEILALQAIQIETQGNSGIDIKESNRDFARRLMTVDSLFSKLAVSNLDSVTQIVESQTGGIAPKDEPLSESQRREDEQLVRLSESLKASILGLSVNPMRPKVPPQRVLADQEALFTYVVPLIQFLAVPVACDIGIPLLAFLILWSLGRKIRPMEERVRSEDQDASREPLTHNRKGTRHEEVGIARSSGADVRPIWAAIRAGRAPH